MSIAPPVGALSAYLARLISSGTFISVREVLRKLARRMPRPLHIAARKAEEFARGLATGGTLFEELGFYYVGPVDGHNIDICCRCWKMSATRPKGWCSFMSSDRKSTRLNSSH